MRCIGLRTSTHAYTTKDGLRFYQVHKKSGFYLGFEIGKGGGGGGSHR